MENQFDKGLNSNARPQGQPFGTYPYGKNGIMFKHLPPQNEPGFNLDPATLPAPTIGIIPIDTNKAVVFNTDNITSYIGYYEWPANTYTAILDDSAFPDDKKLNFNLDWYITGEFQRNYKNQVVVAYTDKHNNPGFINADDPNAADSDDLLLFLRSTAPTVSVSVDNGGILDKGAYYVATRYLKNDGAATGYTAPSGVSLVSSSSTDTITDKALLINISAMDQSYDKIQVAIISRKSGVYAAYELDPVEVSPGTILVIYTGENIVTPIGLEEILISQPVYKTVGTFGQLNDSLFVADLTKDLELDLQKYVNMMKVRVKSDLIEATPPPDEHITGKKRSLLHQEVYAIYARFRIKNGGGYTKPFHIPGNAPTGPDIAAATSPHELDLGALVFHTQDTNRHIDTVTKTADTGIWINDTELYPNLDSFDSSALGGEDLRGLAVRHHRMPSIAFCKTNFYPGETSYGRSKLDILGIEVSNLSLPDTIADQLDGYEILIAKRTLANATVLGQSALMVAAQPNPSYGTDLNYVSTGGNWHSTTRRTNVSSREPDLTTNQAVVLTGRSHASAIGGPGSPNPNAVGYPEMKWRFHSFDLLFNRPAIQPAYLSAQLKMRVNDVAIDNPLGGYVEDGVIDGRQFPIIFIADYTRGIPPVVSPTTARTRVVEDTKYLANDVIAGKWDNRFTEAAFVGELKWIGSTGDTTNNDLPLSCDYGTTNTFFPRAQSAVQRVQWEETYLTNLMDHKLDVYVSFYSQPLIASGQLNSLSIPTSTVYPGDVFINDYSFHTYGWWTSDIRPSTNNDDPSRNMGYKIVRRIICEAASNINSRYEVEANVYSKWWPKSPLASPFTSPAATAYTFYIYQFQRSLDPNQFGYSKDLNAVNDIAGLTPFNPYFEDITEFPYRIHRGGKLPRQGKSRSWRTFLPLDYYEIQKNRGRIIRVLGKDDQLLIHTEHSLFRTQSKVKIETDLLSVVLGTGDIFQFEPQEPGEASNPNGYAGTQHELAAVDTPWGYVFVDADAGQIFSYKKGLKLITNDLSNFFFENMRIVDTNPFRGNGITIGYDPEFERLLLTIKNNTLLNDVNFVPDYIATQDFIDTLTQDVSIVYKDGRYQTFKGVYTPGPYSCPACETPVIHDHTYNIDEDLATGEIVGPLFIDPPITDILDNRVIGRYLLVDTPDSFPFQIVLDDLVVRDNALLDPGTYVFDVRVETVCGLLDDATITVVVGDIDESPIAPDAEIFIYETTPDTTVIHEVVAIDPEAETLLTYTLVTTGVPFAVDPSTGEVSVDGTLDATITNLYELDIEIDDGTSPDPGTVRLTIHILEGTLFIEGDRYACSGTTKQWVSIKVKENDADGAVLAILLNTAGQKYNGFPIIPLANEVASADCPALGADTFIVNNIDSPLLSVTSVTPVFTIGAGTFPLAAGGSVTGTHAGFTDKILVAFSGGPDVTNTVSLYVDNALIETRYTEEDSVKFLSRTYGIGEVIRITIKET